MSPGERNSGLNQRLDTWKEIGAFFGRDERTVKRWEITRGLPVHRVPGAGRANVYANTDELLQWLNGGNNAAELKSNPNSPPDRATGAVTDPDVEMFPDPVSLESAPDMSSDSAASKVSQTGAHLPEGRIAGRRETDAARPESPSVNRTARAFAHVAFALLVLAVLTIVAATYHNWSTRAARKNAATAIKHPVDPDAEQLYLKGIYYFNKRTPAGLNQAVDYFTQAVVRDPQYAEAYVGMADCYNLLREYSLMPESEAYPRAAAAAKRAIALDNSLSGAHSSLGFVDFYWSWDISSADREFRRAIELDPQAVIARHWYATFLLHLAKFPEALDEIGKAQKLDPESTAILADKSLILFYSGSTDQAIAQLQQLTAAEPDFLSPHNYLASIYLAKGNYSQYLAESKKAATLLRDQQRLATVNAGERGWARGGARGMFTAILKQQQTLYAAGKQSSYDLAQTEALLGNKDQAFSYLQDAYARRDSQILRLRIDPTMSSLHSDPRFLQILVKLGLPAFPQS